MKYSVTLGIVCFARTTYDYRAAKELYADILQKDADIESVEWIDVPDLVMSAEEAERVALLFAASHVDGIVCVSGTFHLGHLALLLKRRCNVPFLLWGLPELPYDGGKIRLNSVCGVNLDASNLYKSGYDDYHVAVGSDLDENWIDAIRVIAAMQSAKIGIAGFRADGFFNVGVSDTFVFGQTGAMIDHYELADIFDMAVSEADVSFRKAQLGTVFSLDGISSGQVDKVAVLAAKLSAFYRMHGLSALVIRCWPEFARDYGIAPCAAMSLLQSEGMLLVCEGDIDGALSMIAQQAMGGETPFLFDFSQFDFDEETALLWHCGVAPCNLWDGSSVRSLDTYFAGGKGVTADFVLKSGPVSLLRIDSARGAYRIFLGEADAVPMEKALKGTYMKVVLHAPLRDTLATIVDNGFAHHASAVYGSYIRPMEIVSKIKSWRIHT